MGFGWGYGCCLLFPGTADACRYLFGYLAAADPTGQSPTVLKFDWRMTPGLGFLVWRRDRH